MTTLRRQPSTTERIAGKIAALAMVATVVGGCGESAAKPHVVVYVSVDQVYAEPVFRAFEKKTGIRVDPVYDVEANKVTGLANRILAESRNPQANVFWNGEFVQTIRLANKGALRPYRSPEADFLPSEWVDPNGLWVGTTPRLRVWISSPKFRAENLAFEDLAKLNLPGNKIAISNPVFGTGATQAAAMYARDGREAGRAYYQSLVDKGVRVVDGNGVVRDLVVSGDVTLGLTDTDDACAAVKRHADVRVFLPRETVMFPASVALVRDSPEARQLIDYLLGAEAESILVEAGFCQYPLHKSTARPCLNLPTAKLMKVRPDEIVRQMDIALEDLKARFLR